MWIFWNLIQDFSYLWITYLSLVEILSSSDELILAKYLFHSFNIVFISAENRVSNDRDWATQQGQEPPTSRSSNSKAQDGG